VDDVFIPAELKAHLETCTECHDPAGDGGDAYFCAEAETLFMIFRTLIHANSGQAALVN